MEVLAGVAASAWSYFSDNSNLPLSSLFSTRSSGNANVTALVEKLSANAQVLLPGSDRYEDATMRWSVLAAPAVSFVVVVATEEDVAQTVKFANHEKLPYLAVNGGHGAILTQGRMKNGIEIWLNKLNTVELAKDGKTATIGGGTLSKTVTDTLWKAGKQTVTGCCECTSILGPGLGGGHGFLQGRYGLVSDQFVSMRMVNADGNLISISKKTHPDLWWAMQGAGHNFGIVTSVKLKIYDIVHKTWAYQSFIYTGDKVEGLYHAINEELLKNGTQSVDILNYSFFFNSPGLDPEKPVIMFYIAQEGAAAVDSIYTKPFEDLGTVVTGKGSGDYTQLAAWTGNANDSPPCQKAGLANIRFPIDLDTYSIEAQRAAYDLFAKGTKETPAFANSLFLFEGYSTQGVKAIDSDSTAFAFRANNLLVSPLITYQRDGSAALDKQAAGFGESLRQVLHRGSGRKEMHTYVNYAYGDESLKNLYGYEDWRQKKLKSLKGTYDPHGRFNFYAPIA
ncbi:6-hydroxy-D-nicotine oxidase [Penicillium chermesinum]|uniref:6-hydroxy-D-nicotine oxidase n=1 Tax=Penicillium chermesinum TaxID=63820 RepID=A0A9W9NCQ6_9EURO|nr:6-hydroxy-D-nicotine oxidase [Penicillium chermesinum]KAJ5217451.1 6-hydroxy-D-nicotine oxidase [Penicillium chermesinum]